MEGDDADGITPDHAGIARQIFAGQGAVLHAGRARKEAKHVGNRGDLVVEGRGQGLAGIVRFELGELRALGFDAIGQPQQKRRAVLGNGLCPAGCGGLGGRHRRIDLSLTGLGDFGDASSGCGIQNLFDRAFTRNQRSIDQELSLHVSPPPYAFSSRRRRRAGCAPSPIL